MSFLILFLLIMILYDIYTGLMLIHDLHILKVIFLFYNIIHISKINYPAT